MVSFPNCKINLGLRIIRKRDDGFHDLETVFYPVAIRDALEIITSADDQQVFTQTGISIPGTANDNLCLKAWQLIKKDFPTLPAVKIHLHKCIPTGAGLGGGSADAAFTLIALNKKYNLGLNEEQLSNYALQLGSDCPFFIKNQPGFATGKGEKLMPVKLELGAYKLVVVNPGIHISTAAAFREITPNQPDDSLIDIISLPLNAWRGKLVNDFEAVVTRSHPDVKALIEKLYAGGAIYAAMSGSGSTVFGFFEKDAQLDFDFPADWFFRVI